MKRLSQISGSPTDCRQPITVELLRGKEDFNDLVLLSVFSVALFALLRVSEFAVTSSFKRVDSPALRISHIRIFPSLDKPDTYNPKSIIDYCTAEKHTL